MFPYYIVRFKQYRAGAQHHAHHLFPYYIVRFKQVEEEEEEYTEYRFHTT